MLFLLSLASLATLANSGLISHDLGGDDEYHSKATSYQNIHIEHFHPVPTYVKKEDKHLLEHPISLGTSSSKVEIHHGGKHDHGFAVASVENDLHGHGIDGLGDLGGDHEASFGGHGAVLGGHGAALGGHEASFEGQEASLGGQEASLGGHEESLGGQEVSLGGHEASYGGHEGALGGHAAILGAGLETGGHDGGHEALDGGGYEGGHEIASAGYEVHDQSSDYSQFQGQLGHGGYDNLGHYGLALSAADERQHH